MRNTFIIAFMLLSSNVFAANEANISLKNEPLTSYINLINNQGYRVSILAMPIIDGDKNRVLLDDVLLGLKAKEKAGTLTQNELLDLRRFEKAMEANKDHKGIVIAYKQARETVDFKSKDLPGILNELVAAFPNYQWRQSNTSFVVFPKGYKIRLPETFTIHKGSFDEAMKEFLPVLQRNNIAQYIGAPLFWLGPENPAEKELQKCHIDHDLNLGGLLITDALSRISEALGSNIIWHMWGNENGNSIIFQPRH